MAGRVVYFSGEFVPERDANVSIFDCALMYGDMAFEMTRTFGGRSFKLREHLERLYGSLRLLEIDCGLTIDEMEESLNEEAARVIALRQPAASDLRVVLSVMRMSANLERIGDLSKNLAKRTGVLAQMAPINGSTSALRRMARDVEMMLKDALDAYIKRDEALARDVIERDADAVALAERLYGLRYRTPRPNPQRVVIRLTPDRVLGSAPLFTA